LSGETTPEADGEAEEDVVVLDEMPAEGTDELEKIDDEEELEDGGVFPTGPAGFPVTMSRYQF